MKTIGRAVLAFVVFSATYLFTYWIPFSLIPGARVIAWLPNVVSLAVGVAAGWFVRKRTGATPEGLMTSMAYGAAVVGAISFSAGFFIPMLLTSSGQGPLLGLFVTGPLGAVVGAIAGAAAWSRRRRSTPAM